MIEEYRHSHRLSISYPPFGEQIDRPAGWYVMGSRATPPRASCLPVSVIISTRNRPALLRDTLKALLAAEQLPAEVVIVDQSDEPDPPIPALARASDCEIRYLHSPHPGASAARNLGARSASQDILVFLDDDLTVDRGWLAAFGTALVRRGLKVVCTGQVREAASGPGSYAPSCTNDPDPALYAGRTRRDVLSSGNMALHRAAFETVGGFDERLGPGKSFPAAEDNDLGFRLLEAGYTIAYLPDALAWHRAWRAEDDVVGLKWRYGLGQGAFYAKHLKQARTFMAHRLLDDVTRPLRVLPERVRGRRARRLLGDWAYAAGVLAGLVRWLRVYR